MQPRTDRDGIRRHLRTISPAPSRRILFGAAVALLTIGIVAGGSASYVPLFELLVEWTAIVVLTLWIWLARSRLGTGSSLLLAGVIAVPLIQLVPLPPGLWMRLPGFGDVAAIGIASGIDPWRPLSINPDATTRSALSTLPFVAMTAITTALDDRDRRLLLWVFVALAGAGLAFGMVQMIGRDPHAYIFLNNSFGLPLGFFANRNHQGIFLALAAAAALCLCETFGAGRIAPVRIAGAALAAIFAAGAVATGSRAASALLVVGCLVSMIGDTALPVTRRMSMPHALRAFAIGGIALAGMLALVVQTGAVAHLLHRLTTIDDRSRIEIWEGAWAAILAHFPLGSGMGTFVLAHHAVERLDHVSSHYANRAHNDYLELLVEAGLIGVVAIVGAAFLFARIAIRTYRREDGQAGRVARFTVIGTVLLLLHSLVDYPLRTFALSIVLGLLLGSLIGRDRPGSTRSPQD